MARDPQIYGGLATGDILKTCLFWMEATLQKGGR